MIVRSPQPAAPHDAPGGDRPRNDLEERLREAEATLEAAHAELRELQHRAKNSLQMVISLLKLQVGRIRDPEARAAYEQTLLRIEALAILYRQLHESGTGTHVDVVRYLDELSETVTDSQPGAARGVTIEIAAEPVQAGLYEAMPLGLIVVELLTTSLRHAFPSEGWVRLTLTRTGDKLARLEIADNGRALPAGFDEDMDTGMMLVEALAGQLGDGLNTESTPHGSAASFTFPVWN